MSAYPGSGQAQLLRSNHQIALFGDGGTVGELVAAGTLSQAVQLERINRTFYPFGASFQLTFGGNPGVFEVDIMTSDIDEQIYYCTINSLTSTAQLNSNYSGRVELPNFWAKYVAVYVKTLTNPVTVAALVTR